MCGVPVPFIYFQATLDMKEVLKVVKKFDFDFLVNFDFTLLIQYKSALEKVSLCVCVSVCLSVCLSVCHTVAERRAKTN